MADIDLQALDASHEFADGVIFERVDPEGSGTGTYEPFLTIQHKDTEAGFNSTEDNNLDNVDTNGGLDGRTNDLLLADVPIVYVDGVAYYEFRVDLNEDNNDPVISIESLEIYASDSPAIGDDFQGVGSTDAFLAADGYDKVFDLDAYADRLILTDETSSGSGTDDYRLLVPVELFGDADPTTTYLVLYTEMGLANDALDSSATFEEWNTLVAPDIEGMKFEDLDSDGVKDENEVGLGGVTVFIDEDRDGVFDEGERSTVTDSDGSFTFYSVTTSWADGDVWVDEVVPDGYQQTTGTHEVVDVSGTTTVTAEIGNAPMFGDISGTKTADTDNDNVGDEAVAGWTIYLYEDEDGDGVIDAEDALLATTTTDSNGDYSFEDLTPGDYIVKEESQTGWQNVTPITVSAEVVANATTDVDFVNEELGSISGTKLADTDNDDVGDEGVADWTIELYEDEDGDGVIDAEDALLATTTTDSNGDYSFDDLAPGDYIVKEESKSGWQNISLTVQGAEVTAGDDTDVDFVNEELGSISGTKLADTDNDDIGDEGVADWTIELYEDEDGDGVIDAEDALLATTTTDSNGDYSFDDLAPGDYIVKEETKSGWQAVSLTVQGAEVTAGDDTDVDFVNEELGSISGTKLADTDNDDVGDEGVADWTIELYEDEDGDGVIDAEDALLATTTTDSNGDYSFDDLAPGDYIVKEETKSGWQAVSLTVQGAEVTAGDDTDVDFVNEELGSISGTKLADTDNDDVGDEGVADWTIELYEDEDGDGVIDAEDALLATTTTDSNGDYSFDDLAPGDYIVKEETKSGWQAVSLTVQGAEVTAGDDTDVDFVNEELGSISGTKLADTDNDDIGDEGVADWTIELYEDEDGDGVIDAEDALLDTTTTDSNGDYSFDDLAPGDYIVKEETKSGWQNISLTVQSAAVTAGDDTDVDFVNEELGSISGSKLADTDNDDIGDTGVADWTIELYEDEDGDGVIDAEDALLATTTTDSNGDYSFDDLAPGDYIVKEESKSGWQNISLTVQSAAVTAGDDTDVDFVNEELGSISGTKWADLDNDGVREAGEDGLQGWTISLFLDDGDGFLDAGDTLVDTTQTDVNGDYEFDDLAPGDYIVVETVQNGWVQTSPNGADADPESNDVNGGGMGYSEFGYLVDLSAGEEDADNDFGNFLIPGPGVRTPGFWGSPNGLLFWDGIVGNETKSGPDFPSGELAPDGYLILGDDGDGIAEAGELQISVTDAQQIINASNKDKNGAGFMLARDVIATWLNYLAGNPIGDPGDTDSAAYFLDEGVDWMIKYLNDNGSGGNTLTLAEVRSHPIKTTSAAWTVGTSDDGIESGADIHSALDEYNNDGTINGLTLAQDGDNGFSLFEAQFQSLLTQQAETYFV